LPNGTVARRQPSFGIHKREPDLDQFEHVHVAADLLIVEVFFAFELSEWCCDYAGKLSILVK
jgi:hypothetical protein